jgi:hypothetical protein
MSNVCCGFAISTLAALSYVGVLSLNFILGLEQTTAVMVEQNMLVADETQFRVRRAAGLTFPLVGSL